MKHDLGEYVCEFSLIDAVDPIKHILLVAYVKKRRKEKKKLAFSMLWTHSSISCSLPTSKK
jgi:hypothetical protein